MADKKEKNDSKTAEDTQESANVTVNDDAPEVVAEATEATEAPDDATTNTEEQIETVEDAVSDAVSDAVEDAVEESPVEEIAQDAVEDAVSDAVTDAVQEAPIEEVTQDAIEDAVADAVQESPVEEIAQDAVEDAVSDADTIEETPVEEPVNEPVPEFVVQVMNEQSAEVSDNNNVNKQPEDENNNIVDHVVNSVGGFVEDVHENISEASNDLYQRFDPDKDYVMEHLEKPEKTEQPVAGSTMSTTNLSQYELTPSNTWPPPIYVRPDATNNERFYIEYRWHSQWAYYDSKASTSKKWYQRLQLIIGVGSVTVPVLVGFQSGNASVQTMLQVLTVAISLLVAAAAAIENVFTYGDNWRNFRSAAEELAREKAMYDMHAGPYRRSKNPFLLFTERCEDVIAKQNNAWTQMIEEKADKDDDEPERDRESQVTSSYSSETTTTTYSEPSYEDTTEDVGAAVG